MTVFEQFQNRLLSKLGYEDILPFDGDCFPKFVYLKDNKFCFLDDMANESNREDSAIGGDILVKKDEEGYYYCPSLSEKGKPKQYHFENVYRTDYYILREDNHYIELSYLFEYPLCSDDAIEYTVTDHYFAIKFHKKDNAMVRDDNPYLDAIVAKGKDISHLGVLTYFYKDKIVVADKETVIVYNEEMNVLYKGYGDFEIMEKGSKCYLIVPRSCVVYELAEGRRTKLGKDENDYWYHVKTYRDIFVLYNQHRYHVNRTSYYDDDDSYSDYENSPIKNTEGCVYDLNFKLLRKFNVFGKIYGLTDFGDTIAMMTLTNYNNFNSGTIQYYNAKGDNKTIRYEKNNEEFSVPDFHFSSMKWYESRGFLIVSNRGKSGVFISSRDSKRHKKLVVNCKYDNIKSLPLKEEIVYYVGVMGENSDNNCDLYVNHKILLQNYPFNRGDAIKVVGNGYFIKYTDLDGKIGFIRNGEVVFKPLYKKAEVYVEETYCELEDIMKIEFLYVVSDGERYGICSPSGDLILPIEYKIIDVDNRLNIIIGNDANELEVDKNDKSIMSGNQMMVGHYSKETNSIIKEKAKVKDNAVQLDDEGDYVWDGKFRYTNYCNEDEFHSPWVDYTDKYTVEDSLYDALGGEMDAVWNID